ncbi:conserved hypothetical protein [Sphingobacterium multivorum]|uniref:Uncharacterized protein n=1 Tax=Sphingobacterium multivorum TaxID=28454 RepID=A0A654A184_SPHMU|nr:conserved hypothetical protein [Sphingobacterium multivorum]
MYTLQRVDGISLPKKKVSTLNFQEQTKIISLKISPNTLLSSFLFAEIRIVRIFASSNVNDIITIAITFELFVR